MASWQAFAIRTILRFTMKRAGRNGIDVDKARAFVRTPRPHVLKIWPGWNVGPRVVEGLTFETYDRADGPTLRDDLVVLYLHGGGYFVGSPQTHRQLALNMAKHCDALPSRDQKGGAQTAKSFAERKAAQRWSKA